MNFDIISFDKSRRGYPEIIGALVTKSMTYEVICANGKLYFLDSGGFLISPQTLEYLISLAPGYLSHITEEQAEQINSVLGDERIKWHDQPHEKEAPISKPTFIYVMYHKRSDYYKIGRSKEPKFRERTLQAEDPDVKLLFSFPGNIATETLLHDRFKDKRIRGEWFKLTPDDVAFIKSLEKL